VNKQRCDNVKTYIIVFRLSFPFLFIISLSISISSYFFLFVRPSNRKGALACAYL
jgi:hypothetical protein